MFSRRLGTHCIHHTARSYEVHGTAFYDNIPDYIIEEMRSRLPQEFWEVIARLESIVFK